MRNSFRRILFPTDFSSTSESALKQALALAESYEAELHLVTVVDHTLYSYARYPDASLREDLVAAAKIRIRNFDIPSSSPELNVQRVVLEGDIAEQVSSYVRDFEIDLVVMASHARSKVARFFMGSVADRVLHLAGCPAMVMRAPEGTARNPVPSDRRFNTIVTPTDFSKPAEQGLMRAIDFALDYDAKLYVVHAIDDRKLMMLEESRRKDALTKIREDVTDHLEEWCAKIPPEVDVEAKILIGDTTEKVGQFASKHNCDLVVIGARAIDEFKRLLVGSVADSMVRVVDCPVFVEHVVDDTKGSGVSTARIEAAIGGITISRVRKERSEKKKKKKSVTKRKSKTTTRKKSKTKTATRKKSSKRKTTKKPTGKGKTKTGIRKKKK